MIEKTANPLNLGIKQVDAAINELQKAFNAYSFGMGCLGFSLDENGVSLEIETKTGKYSYSLEQLKKLKTELMCPMLQSLGEVS